MSKKNIIVVKETVSTVVIRLPVYENKVFIGYTNSITVNKEGMASTLKELKEEIE